MKPSEEMFKGMMIDEVLMFKNITGELTFEFIDMFNDGGKN